MVPDVEKPISKAETWSNTKPLFETLIPKDEGKLNFKDGTSVNVKPLRKTPDPDDKKMSTFKAETSSNTKLLRESKTLGVNTPTLKARESSN